MAREEIIDRKPASSELPIQAYTIKAFCRVHGISESLYFKLKNQGLGPAEMEVGTRRLISLEAAAAWRRARQRTTIKTTIL
jgi:hypothetical protein